MTQTQGRYAVVDTTLTKTDSTLLDSLSGRQGDNGRVVYFAIKDGNLPHNLDGQDVTLQVKDAAGKIKVVNGIYDMISATAGLFSMLIPAEVYQAAGDVEEAFLVITDQQNLVISSIPITFTVFANGIIISANASKDYVSSVQEMVDEVNKQIKLVQTNIDAQQTAYDSLMKGVENLTKLVNDNQVATLNSNNTFTKNVTVEGTINGHLVGTADNATLAENATSAETAKIATRDAVAYKYQTTVDLNALPNVNDIYTHDVYYFSSATSLKNTPEGIVQGIVETFVLTSVTLFQRVTDTISQRTWTRRITNWQTDEPYYMNWRNQSDVYTKVVGAFGSSLEFTRIGNTVNVHLYESPSDASFREFTTVYAAGFIPVGYRPAISQLVTAETGGGTQSTGTLAFNPSGSIESHSANMNPSNNTWLYISGSYLTADSMPI